MVVDIIFNAAHRDWILAEQPYRQPSPKQPQLDERLPNRFHIEVEPSLGDGTLPHAKSTDRPLDDQQGQQDWLRFLLGAIAKP